MAEENEKSSADEQGYLIDVHPENEKEILAKARAYRGAVIVRLEASKEEVELKSALLELVKDADLQPMADGKIKFSLDGLKITITPRDMLVQVKCADEAIE